MQAAKHNSPKKIEQLKFMFAERNCKWFDAHKYRWYTSHTYIVHTRVQIDGIC